MDDGRIDLQVNGARLVALPAGALYWPDEETLIVADLHFEKGTAYARDGVLLPPYDTRTTLRRLAVIAKRLAPARIVSLGDAFHDRGAQGRMDAEDADFLAALMGAVRWTWILGNHAPEPPARFRADTAEALRVGPVVFRHEPVAGPAPGEICGHLHPCARVKASGRLIRRRCFAGDGTRLILPAFGAYTGGLNVLDAAYEGLFGELTAWVLGGKGVYPFASRKLAPDGPGGARVVDKSPWRAHLGEAPGPKRLVQR
ncbi:MAG: ligase-associated DNA damage response endonuclease PdeM [Parvularculaceae bacterium]